jgi:hypothetical protein
MPPKAGVKTSEFWTNAILQIILLLNTVGIWNYMPQKYTALTQAILGAAYAMSRGLAKISPPGATAATAVYPIEPPGDTTEAPAVPPAA